MDDARLDSLQSLADAATPGPWRDDNPDDSYCMNMYVVMPASEPEPNDEDELNKAICVTLLQTKARIGGTSVRWDANARFIAAARTAVPELIAEVRRLRAENAGYVSVLDDQHAELMRLTSES